MSNSIPPRWAPNAIATERGWVDPKTKELLVANRNLIGDVIKFSEVNAPIIKEEEEVPTKRKYKQRKNKTIYE